MQHMLKRLGKDHLGAALLVVLGTVVVVLGVGYRMGTLNRMGPGFIPVVLGTLMVLVGLAIAITAAPAGVRPKVAPQTGVHGGPSSSGPQWRGWLCILGGVMAFVVLGDHGGLVPATFFAVFISALGDRNNTLKSATLLGLILVAMAVVVFHYGLQLQLQLFAWN